MAIRPRVAGAAVLLALSLAACGEESVQARAGGPPGPPRDASLDDFCAGIAAIDEDEELNDAIDDEDWDQAADLFRDRIEEFAEIGTPEGIPDDAREGYEIVIERSRDVSGDDFEQASEAEGDGHLFSHETTDEEDERIEAYEEYEDDTCDGDEPA